MLSVSRYDIHVLTAGLIHPVGVDFSHSRCYQKSWRLDLACNSYTASQHCMMRWDLSSINSIILPIFYTPLHDHHHYRRIAHQPLHFNETTVERSTSSTETLTNFWLCCPTLLPGRTTDYLTEYTRSGLTCPPRPVHARVTLRRTFPNTFLVSSSLVVSPMPTKAHLRQRHGSDALRLERFDRERSSSIVSDTRPDGSAATTDPNTPMTPMNVNKTRAQSPKRASRPVHTRSTSSSYMSPRLSSQTFEQQRNRSPQRFGKLPAGASTPSLESSSHNGQPIASYPPAPATWSNMPNKFQLAILALSRFVDFFQMAALQTYMVHQLKSFDPSLPDSTISHQAGVLQGSFTAAQIITSILWGRAADQPGVGRKLVLLIGLIGTGITMLGVGFSTTYSQAVFWRVLGGAVNGTVGSARTMVAECVDKRWHPRAFLLLPAAFNVANVAGPSIQTTITHLPTPTDTRQFLAAC